MSDICTIHQPLTEEGHPTSMGTEVRLPSGEVIPWVQSITIKAVPDARMWETTITLMARFGDPIVRTVPIKTESDAG